MHQTGITDSSSGMSSILRGILALVSSPLNLLYHSDNMCFSDTRLSTYVLEYHPVVINLKGCWPVHCGRS